VARRERLQRHARRLLEPTEAIQQIVVAVGSPRWLGRSDQWVIVVTNEGIALLDHRRPPLLRRPRSIVLRYPRVTELGPIEHARGRFGRLRGLSLGAMPLFVHRRYFGDVEAADQDRVLVQRRPRSMPRSRMAAS
jgi:hypothetical protein